MDDFTALEDKYGLPHGYLSRTRAIESGNGRDTYNAKSGAAGDFQFIPSTAKQYGLTNPYDTAASAEAAARLAADNKGILESAGIKNPTAAQLYLAHQQGAGGAVGLLNSSAPAGSIVGDKAIAWNAGDPNKSGSAFANKVMDHYNGAEAPKGTSMFEGLFGGGGAPSNMGQSQVGSLGAPPIAMADIQGLQDPSMWDKFKGMFGGGQPQPGQAPPGGNNMAMGLLSKAVPQAIPHQQVPQMQAHTGAQGQGAALPQLNYAPQQGALGQAGGMGQVGDPRLLGILKQYGLV